MLPMSSIKLIIFYWSSLQLVFTRALEKSLQDDDMECKRHNNEGVCTSIDNHYTCACLNHEKPLLAISEWHEDQKLRVFSQTCEQVKLPFHEDTCVVLPGNPENKEEYEFLCPNEGFFQTWGAFAPLKGNYSVRLWYRCCQVKCPKWNCQWTPYNPPNEKFVLPMKDVYVQGTKGKYYHEKEDSSWSLKLCACDTSKMEVKEEL